MTKIKLNDTIITLCSLDNQEFTLPMTLDTLTSRVNNDTARIILYARHYPTMPRNIIGVIKWTL